jgi:hypothetical protein
MMDTVSCDVTLLSILRHEDSDERITNIIWVKRISELGTTLAVTNN